MEEERFDALVKLDIMVTTEIIINHVKVKVQNVSNVRKTNILLRTAHLKEKSVKHCTIRNNTTRWRCSP